MSDGLRIERRDQVLVATIDRPAIRNALDDATIRALQRMLDAHRAGEVRGIVLTGAGGKAFSAGSDLKEMARQTLAERLVHTEIGQTLVGAIEQHPCAILAAIEGHCVGGGLELALACDYRVVAQGARLSIPEVALNALPTWGGCTRLPKLVGLARARELVLFGRVLDADTALAWGLASEVVAEGQALERAVSVAAALAETTDAPTYAAAKRLLVNSWGVPASTAGYLEYLSDMTQLSSERLEGQLGRFDDRRQK